MIYLIFLSLIITTNALTGSQVRDVCHCNLHPNICDMQCCCDTDCFSSISGNDSCFRTKSTQFCIQQGYYYKINSAAFSENSCYYYNKTQTVQQEVSLNTQTINVIANQNSPFQPQNSVVLMYKGYSFGDLMFVDNSVVLSSLGSNCNAGWTSGSFNLQFGKDFYLACTSTFSGTNVGLFSAFSNKKIYKFAGDSTQTLTIPTISAEANSVTLYFLINTYGSQKLNYIQAIQSKITTSSSPSNLRKIMIKFIKVQQSPLLAEDYPSIFPQIPTDIFYPIYMLN